jgi:hypothetical protein
VCHACPFCYICDLQKRKTLVFVSMGITELLSDKRFLKVLHVKVSYAMYQKVLQLRSFWYTVIPDIYLPHVI